MKIEQYVMAYEAKQDRIRAILPEDFESLRPVPRINAEVRDGSTGEKSNVHHRFSEDLQRKNALQRMQLIFSVNRYWEHIWLYLTDKICYSDKPHCTITSCAYGLYRNPMLCERLAGRKRILFEKRRKMTERAKESSLIHEQAMVLALK